MKIFLIKEHQRHFMLRDASHSTPEGDSIEKERVFNRRTFIVAIIQILGASVSLVKLVGMQVFKKKSYQILSEKNQYKPSFIIPRRGKITSSDGKPLAHNKACLSAILDPESFSEASKTLARFAKIAEIPNPSRFVQLMEREIRKDRQQELILIENLSRNQMVKIEYNLFQLKGVSIIRSDHRIYPLQEKGAHLIGYVSKLKKDEIGSKNKMFLKLANQNYRTGKMGIEKTMNEQLTGRLGIQISKVNAGRKVLERTTHQEPVEGKEVRLTINYKLQKEAQKLLDNKEGAITLLDITNGDILAMCSAPTFNPNTMLTSMETKDWGDMNQAKNVFINKTLNACYSPGSIFKIASSLDAIETDSWTKNVTFNCTGKYSFAKRVIHCHKKEGHGVVSLEDAIAQSCNCYFYHMATKATDIDQLAQTARMLGFGTTYDIADLQSKKGIIPDREWKKQNFKTKWFAGETINTIIGQGYLQVTPLQMAIMATRIASSNNVLPRVIQNSKQQSFKPLNFRAENIKTIQSAMFKTFSHKAGTCHFLHTNIPKYHICGKTGTAQVISRIIEKEEMKTGRVKQEIIANSLFVGYGPQEAPRFATSIVLDHGGSGVYAAIVGQQMLKKAIDVLG